MSELYEMLRRGVGLSKNGATIGDVNRRLRPLLLLSAALLLTAATLLTNVGSVAAEEPGFIAEEVMEDGVYVAPGRSDIDEAELEAVVQSLRFRALRVVVVAPEDPQPSSKAFARRVQEATDADVAIVFPPPNDEILAAPLEGDAEGGSEGSDVNVAEAEVTVEAFVIEDLQENNYLALQKARELSDPARSVEAFAKEIQSTIEVEQPAFFGQLLWALALLASGLLATFAIERAISRVRSSSTASKEGMPSAPTP